jgi:hypothetical protein
MRVFVSSTCYDFGILREQLRGFIQGFGFEPVMSDFGDILYDHKDHTHISCLRSVEEADMLILFIGSRFGGNTIPQVSEMIDYEKLANQSKSTDFLKEPSKASITQLEVLRAIERGVPIFPFIQKDVLHDHRVYTENKKEGIEIKINYPSIANQASAKYIFEFFNFLRHRNRGNYYFSFEKFDEIAICLRKQWSMQFKRLLNDSMKESKTEAYLFEFSEQIKDLKTALLTTVSGNAKETAKYAVRYRHIISHLRNMLPDADLRSLLRQSNDLVVLLKIYGYTYVYEHRNQTATSDFREPFITLCGDNFYLKIARPRVLPRLRNDLKTFTRITETIKDSVIDALLESEEGVMLGVSRYFYGSFENMAEQEKESQFLSKMTIDEYFSRETDDKKE